MRVQSMRCVVRRFTFHVRRHCTVLHVERSCLERF